MTKYRSRTVCKPHSAGCHPPTHRVVRLESKASTHDMRPAWRMLYLRGRINVSQAYYGCQSRCSTPQMTSCNRIFKLGDAPSRTILENPWFPYSMSVGLDFSLFAIVNNGLVLQRARGGVFLDKRPISSVKFVNQLQHHQRPKRHVIRNCLFLIRRSEILQSGTPATFSSARPILR